MRDPLRVYDILHELMKLWQKYPDQRLGQLLVNVAELRGIIGCRTDIWHIEDDEWLERIQKAAKGGLSANMEK